MGLQLLALAKINALFSSQTSTPLLAGLIWPFIIKLSFSSRLVRETYLDLVRSSSLFFFQIRQIAVQPDHIQPSRSDGAAAVGSSVAAAGGSGGRWGRALRLVYRSMTRARRSMPTPVEDEDSLHALSILAL
ncbi:hypothetical protein SAY87_019596 [Trapa incisa]|uniref:Uncharacterized protein n=2 Tax=Trapa TaxID=22665 RepID=A0AAN7RAW5_TRANT|nr:hypothetical protein SAY87_019596 [Trapa incisa]KAK4793681.1 hypothetical protein SAY86_024116 [Trapa natans]